MGNVVSSDAARTFAREQRVALATALVNDAMLTRQAIYKMAHAAKDREDARRKKICERVSVLEHEIEVAQAYIYGVWRRHDNTPSEKARTDRDIRDFLKKHGFSDVRPADQMKVFGFALEKLIKERVALLPHTF